MTVMTFDDLRICHQHDVGNISNFETQTVTIKVVSTSVTNIDVDRFEHTRLAVDIWSSTTNWGHVRPHCQLLFQMDIGDLQKFQSKTRLFADKSKDTLR